MLALPVRAAEAPQSLDREPALTPSPSETRILICDELHPAALELFHRDGFEPEVRTGMNEAELIEAARDVHALVVRSATRITAPVIQAAEYLQLVGRAGVGVDNIDCNAATQRGVIVMNTPTGNSTTTAELAIALLTSIARHIPRADRATRSGDWKKKGLLGTELTGKTLGVIGLGRIGRIVAERGAGLKMNVVACDPYLSGTGASSPLPGVELVTLEELLQRADFVTLHVPLMDSTRNLLSRERIALMKRGARLINAARGGLIDEAALATALDEGRLAGAALDVLAEEPPTADHPLVGRDDVILTPHLGASSHEAQENVAVGIAEQISTYFREGVAHNAVNAPAVSAKTRALIRHHIILAEKMGAYLAQRMDQPIRKIEFTVAGEVAEQDEGYLALSFLTAVLRQSMESGINFVNAPLLAAERGIRLLQSTATDTHFFTSYLKARVSSKGGGESHLAAGTVFGEHPRLVRVDDMHVDLPPLGVLLVTQHNDRPGVLGTLGSLLGRHGINISRMELGPKASASGLASAFLSLDERPSSAVVDEIRALEPIEYAKIIEL